VSALIIDQFREAVERMHGGSAQLAQFVPVRESFEGKTVWEGVVHVFDLTGHPTATRAYAWSSPIEGSTKRRFVAVCCISRRWIARKLRYGRLSWRRSALGSRVIHLLVLVVTLSVLAAIGSASYGQGVMTFGDGVSSCGRWAGERRGSPERALKETWLLGFVSGYNWYRRDEDVRPIDSDALIAWIDSYCSIHPLDLIAKAAGRLIDELRAERGLTPIMRSN
jgi:hypothetical protein